MPTKNEKKIHVYVHGIYFQWFQLPYLLPLESQHHLVLVLDGCQQGLVRLEVFYQVLKHFSVCLQSQHHQR
jgi:hypothetical protein